MKTDFYEVFSLSCMPQALFFLKNWHFWEFWTCRFLKKWLLRGFLSVLTAATAAAAAASQQLCPSGKTPGVPCGESLTSTFFSTTLDFVRFSSANLQNQIFLDMENGSGWLRNGLEEQLWTVWCIIDSVTAHMYHTIHVSRRKTLYLSLYTYYICTDRPYGPYILEYLQKVHAVDTGRIDSLTPYIFFV